MGISPAYTIHQYSEGIYKVVAFKGNRDPDFVHVRDQEEEQHYDTKLNEAFCRAKSMVLQYALCNPWDYFFTGTLDEKKFNRYELDTYQQKLSQFIRDKRKAYGSQIQFLLVPEQHKDGAWHMDITLRRLAQNYFVVKKSLLPFFIVCKKIRRKVGIDDMTHQIIDKYYFGFPIIDSKWVFSPPLWKLFNSYSRREMPIKDWEEW